MGEIIIDHRASPGLPEDVARQAGYDPKLCREGKLYEAETLTCSHCRNVVVKNPFRTRERNYCAKCSGHYICDYCAYQVTLSGHIHMSFEKIIERHFYQDGSAPQLLLKG